MALRRSFTGASRRSFTPIAFEDFEIALARKRHYVLDGRSRTDELRIDQAVIRRRSLIIGALCMFGLVAGCLLVLREYIRSASLSPTGTAALHAAWIAEHGKQLPQNGACTSCWTTVRSSGLPRSGMTISRIRVRWWAKAATSAAHPTRRSRFSEVAALHRSSAGQWAQANDPSGQLLRSSE